MTEPPLGLAGVSQRNGNTNMSGTRLTAAAARKVLNIAFYCLCGYTPDFLLGLSPLALPKPVVKHKAVVCVYGDNNIYMA